MKILQPIDSSEKRYGHNYMQKNNKLIICCGQNLEKLRKDKIYVSFFKLCNVLKNLIDKKYHLEDG